MAIQPLERICANCTLCVPPPQPRTGESKSQLFDAFANSLAIGEFITETEATFVLGFYQDRRECSKGKGQHVDPKSECLYNPTDLQDEFSPRK